jgi:hypothetical protein
VEEAWTLQMGLARGRGLAGPCGCKPSPGGYFVGSSKIVSPEGLHAELLVTCFSRRQPALRLAANCGRQACPEASGRTRRLFSQAVFDRIEVCDRKLASIRYQAPFDLLFSTSKYEAVVAHALSYSNLEELRVRVAGLV